MTKPGVLPSLLTTKLYRASTTPNLVTRPRLTQQLDDALRQGHPLILVAAPAGYGKTTLVTDWLGQASIPAAWLSLDEGDNDPVRFFTYVVAALQTLDAKLGQSLLDTLHTIPQSPEAFVYPLINDLAAAKRPIILALDDYHVITGVLVQEAMALLLEHVPPDLHLVLLTRADPALPLARLRGGGQLTEVRAGHLRFTSEEAAAFLNQMMGLRLTADEIAALEARTEGWIVGLQMAALSMRERSDTQAFLAAFSGSHYYVLDYLTEEVLQRQPEQIQRFLLYTSILDRLCGQLCDAVASPLSPMHPSPISSRERGDEVTAARGEVRSQSILEYLERANLFVVPLDNERRWYRYHHLFADVLRSRLQRLAGEQVAALHRRAGAWLRRNGDTDQAIQHTLAANDWPEAAALMDEAGQAAMQRGEIYKIKGWVDALPKSEVHRTPRLKIYYAWATVLAGQFDEAENALAEIGASIANDPALQVASLAVQVWAARGRGELARAVELASQALAYGEAGDTRSRCLLLFSLSLAYWHLGKVRETGAAAAEAIRLAETCGDRYVQVLMLARLALVQAAQGRLHEAEATYLQALQRRPDVPVWVGGGAVHHYLAAVYYEWNELERALEYARLGAEYGRLTNHAEFLINSYRQMAYIYQAQGAALQARAALAEMGQIATERQIPLRLWGPLAAAHAQVALAQGDVATAVRWLEQVQGGYGASFHHLKLPLEGAKLALAQGDQAAAAALLAEQYQVAAAEGIGYAQIEIRALQALAAPDPDQALEFLVEALTLAEPEGFVRVFLDQGPRLTQLLAQVAKLQVESRIKSYARRLLAQMTPGQAPTEDVQPGTRNLQPLIEQLSERELEVLRLVASGMSNRETARELYVTVGTVKKHLNSIFGKLGVSSRTQAAARARELNLLS